MKKKTGSSEKAEDQLDPTSQAASASKNEIKDFLSDCELSRSTQLDDVALTTGRDGNESP
jgi:hypothetical protein